MGVGGEIVSRPAHEVNRQNTSSPSADRGNTVGGRRTEAAVGEIGVVLRLRQKVIEIFEFVRLHARDFCAATPVRWQAGTSFTPAPSEFSRRGAGRRSRDTVSATNSGGRTGVPAGTARSRFSGKLRRKTAQISAVATFDHARRQIDRRAKEIEFVIRIDSQALSPHVQARFQNQRRGQTWIGRFYSCSNPCRIFAASSASSTRLNVAMTASPIVLTTAPVLLPPDHASQQLEMIWCTRR